MGRRYENYAVPMKSASPSQRRARYDALDHETHQHDESRLETWGWRYWIGEFESDGSEINEGIPRITSRNGEWTRHDPDPVG